MKSAEIALMFGKTVDLHSLHTNLLHKLEEVLHLHFAFLIH